jgi:DNA-binding Lrp family transcriptional regulator
MRVARFDAEVWRQLDGTDFRLLELLQWYHKTFGHCFPSRATLAKKLRVRIETVSRHVSKLVRFGVLRRTQRRYRRANGTYATETNVYHVLGFMGAKIRALLHPLTGVTRQRTQSEPKEKGTVSDLSCLKNENLRLRLERFAKLGGLA